MGISNKSVQAYLIDLSCPFASEKDFFWKINWIKKQIHHVKNSKKAQKTLLFSAATWISFLAWKTLKLDFLYFWKSCIELNFLSKNTNPESIGILSSKLWPKYETDAKDNTNSALSSIFSQNFKWGSAINLFKPI